MKPAWNSSTSWGPLGVPHPLQPLRPPVLRFELPALQVLSRASDGPGERSGGHWRGLEHLGAAARRLNGRFNGHSFGDDELGRLLESLEVSRSHLHVFLQLFESVQVTKGSGYAT